MAEKLFFTDLAAANNPPQAIPATCSITTIAAASINDGEIFQLPDGSRNWVFEFDKNGSIVQDPGAGRIRIDVSAALTADQVRDAIIAAINGTGGPLQAFSGGAATVAVRNKFPGPFGNGTTLETVANAGFVLPNMAGGVMSGIALDDAAVIPGGTAFRAFKDYVIWLFSSAGAAQTTRAKVWGFREQIYQADTRGMSATPPTPDNGRGWIVSHVTSPGATDANRGFLNGGTAIAVDPLIANRLYYTERVADLASFSHLYLELIAVTGTFTAGVVADPTWQRRG